MFPELTRDDVFRLETRRLWLRWPRMADASAILRQAGEKAVAEMTASIPHPYPVDAVEPFIFAMRKGNALGEHLVLAITPRSKPNELIGMIGAQISKHRFLISGYVADRDAIEVAVGAGEDRAGLLFKRQRRELWLFQ